MELLADGVEGRFASLGWSHDLARPAPYVSDQHLKKRGLVLKWVMSGPEGGKKGAEGERQAPFRLVQRALDLAFRETDVLHRTLLSHLAEKIPPTSPLNFGDYHPARIEV